MKRFEVGKTYKAYQEEFTPITVTGRTEKQITVKNDQGNTFRMMVRIGKDGNEFVIDSKVPASWKDAFTYFAESEVSS